MWRAVSARCLATNVHSLSMPQGWHAGECCWLALSTCQGHKTTGSTTLTHMDRHIPGAQGLPAPPRPVTVAAPARGSTAAGSGWCQSQCPGQMPSPLETLQQEQAHTHNAVGWSPCSVGVHTFIDQRQQLSTRLRELCFHCGRALPNMNVFCPGAALLSSIKPWFVLLRPPPWVCVCRAETGL